MPEVSLRSDGECSPQFAVASAVFSRNTVGEFPLGTADTKTFAAQISSAASRCWSLMDCSSGRTTSRLRKQAIKIDAQSSWFPIWIAITLPALNVSILLSKSCARASISENFRTTSPCVLRIAGESFARPRMRCQAASNASLDFIPCVTSSARLDFALLFEHESRHSSRVLRYRYCVRVRRGVSHPLDASRH